MTAPVMDSHPGFIEEIDYEEMDIRDVSGYCLSCKMSLLFCVSKTYIVIMHCSVKLQNIGLNK